MNDSPISPHVSDDGDSPDIRHGFAIGDLRLLIPIGVVAELVDDYTVSPIPFTPSWFKGMTNHRGEVVPVFVLPKLFSAQLAVASSNSQHWLLILDKQPYVSGLQIDSYPQRLNALEEIDLASVADAPTLIKPYINRAYLANGQTWFDFQHDDWLLSLKTRFQDYQSLR